MEIGAQYIDPALAWAGSQVQTGLHCAFDVRDQDISRDHPVFGSKALCKVPGVQNLGAGREFIVPLPHQDFHGIGAEKGEFIAGVSMGNGLRPQLLTGRPERR